MGSASPASPTLSLLLGAPVQGGSAARSLLQLPACQLGPTQQARLAACLWGESPAAWDPWDGAGQALGPSITEVLWF